MESRVAPPPCIHQFCHICYTILFISVAKLHIILLICKLFVRYFCKVKEIEGCCLSVGSRYSRPIFRWSQACLFLEETAEVLGVLEAEFTTDLRNASLHIRQPLLDGIQRAEFDVLLCRLARFLLDKVAKIVGGEA